MISSHLNFKKMIRRAQFDKLKQLRYMRQAMAMQLCKDLAESRQNNHKKTAIKRVKEDKGDQLVKSDEQNHTIAESKINTPEVEETEAADNPSFSFSISKPSDSFSLPESTSTETSILVSSVQQYPQYAAEEVEKEDSLDLQNKGEIMALGPSSERDSLLKYAEAVVEYYVDEEIEESEGFVLNDGYYQDQDRVSLSYDYKHIDQEKSRSERSSIRGFRKSKGGHKKRLRRRSCLLERQGIIETECIIYYQKPCKSLSTQKHETSTNQYNRRRKKPLVERIPQSNYNLDKENSIRSCQSLGNTERNAFNLDLCDCSLDQPCYCCFYYDQEYYSRALTMTSPKNCKDIMLRACSFNSQQPKHVHPRLPEYEDIIAIFTALKRERLEEKIKQLL